MIDDVIELLQVVYDRDSAGNEVAVCEKPRKVFCRVESVSRSEFYQAAQADMHPQYIFRISNFRDYLGEQALLYQDWTGKKKRYEILRTYKAPGSDEIELTAGEKVGSYGIQNRH